MNGHLQFKNVSFTYPGAENPAIENISFELTPGKTTAIIGGTGAGKSTLINLIMRFYDATNGEILINGVNIKEMKTHDLRERIGYIPQKALLFSGTINENLKFGNTKITDEEIKKAAEIAQASDFINEKENKFEEQIAQGGSNVSGGQRQRLSIARALAKKPEIYLFDDSFSALDFKTDAKLRAALKTYTEDASILIIAQRVSTVIDSDQIIVLNDGEISGIGKHEELLQNCDVYKEIVYSQLSKEELA